MANHKKAKILEYIWDHPGVYRKRMAKTLGYRLNLVSDLVRELISEEWLAEGESQSNGLGRAPIPLYIDSEHKFAIAIRYDQKGLEGALINSQGKIIKKIEHKIALSKPEQVVNEIADLVEQLRKTVPSTVVGIGLADPSMVDTTKGTVVRSSILPEWRDVPLAKMVAERVNLPIFIEDDTRARALGEYLSRPQWRQSNEPMFYVAYGETLGFALANDDGIWRGAGLAGEIGHVVFDSSGPYCKCGGRGCLESVICGAALEERAMKLLEQPTDSLLKTRKSVSIEDIFEAFEAGDRLAKNLVGEITPQLGMVMSFLVSALHPKYVVVAGESNVISNCLCKELQKEVEARSFPEIASSIEFIEGGDFKSIGLVGMGLTVFDEQISRSGEAFVRSDNYLKARR